MDLTPEERHRIYLEEKARAEAIPDSPDMSPGSHSAPRSTVIPLIFTVLAIGALSAGASAVIKHMGAPVVSQPMVYADIATSPLIDELTQLRIITRLEPYDGGYAVIVGYGFYEADFRTKQAAMSALSKLLGPARGGNHFLLYDSQTNKKVGAWRGESGLVVF